MAEGESIHGAQLAVVPAHAVQVTPLDKRAVVRVKSWGADLVSSSLVPPGLGGDVQVLGFSPLEWFLVSDAIDGPKLHERVTQHLGQESTAVVDLSCGLKALCLRGPATRELLSKGCGLDLHPEIFPAGRCTRTRLAQLSVIVHCSDPVPRFDLYVGRSYHAWLCAWLADAAVA